ncbi:MAG: hypothetical protein LBE62_05040 [Azonexus sp.]|jgi:FtsZ-binding cell division protein ZapB|nr:hypothetical protein [Azonexus sp.]
MNDESIALLGEIRDLLREQNALAQDVREMNKESLRLLQESRALNESQMARAERLQSRAEKSVSVSNMFSYGVIIVVLLYFLISYFGLPF